MLTALDSGFLHKKELSQFRFSSLKLLEFAISLTSMCNISGTFILPWAKLATEKLNGRELGLSFIY
jgi:hypothetical protein